MSKVELVYFKNIKGKGQFLRNILIFTGEEFIDTRVESISDDLRKTLPYGQLPVLKVNPEVTLAQSVSIARYLANKHNFAGKTPVEKALADEIVDATQDLLAAFFREYRNGDEVNKEKYKNSTVPRFLGNWEQKLSNSKFVAQGDDYTYADLTVFTIINQLHIDTTPFPKLTELINHFLNVPSISEHYKTIPQSDF